MEGFTMSSIDEYVGLAQQAGGQNAHVAVCSYYRSAIEISEYGPRAGDLLLSVVQYAQRLKKPDDKTAIAVWASDTLNKIGSNTNFIGAIQSEIARLKPDPMIQR